jgi:hypothetical protein
MHRINKKQADELRRAFIAAQNNKCALCRDTLEGKTACLDHDHGTGHIRSVLCLNCNGIEGKIFNLCRRGKRKHTETEFLTLVLYYWNASESYSQNPIHPTHRTAEEKRLARNAKARKKRASKK